MLKKTKPKTTSKKPVKKATVRLRKVSVEQTPLATIAKKKTENGRQAKRLLRILKEEEEAKGYYKITPNTKRILINLMGKIIRADKAGRAVRLTKEENKKLIYLG